MLQRSTCATWRNALHDRVQNVPYVERGSEFLGELQHGLLVAFALADALDVFANAHLPRSRAISSAGRNGLWT